MKRKPHPLNVIGDFYVEESCCPLCGVPEHCAPDLFATGPESSGSEACFVKRQPTTPEELSRMMTTMASQDLDCVRYRGSDAAVARRIAKAGRAELIDPKTTPGER